MAWNRIGNFAVLSLALIFAACGGDSGNNASASEIRESQSSSSKSNQLAADDESCKDDPFFSTWEGCYCDDGVWACNLSTSSSTAQSSSSRCDSCEENKSSSSSIDKQDSVPTSSKVMDKIISGLAQKGPFDIGSTVSLGQLDSKTFVQTASNYIGKVTNASGVFEISNVALSSPYVIFQVSGSYRSEITGKFSSGKITLKSFTDLSSGVRANINVLTHLTSNRIAYLASKGRSFSDAKKQVESEILKIFGVKNEVENFESLNLFGKNNGNAVLLAISILMQRDLSVTDINSLLSEFETYFEKTGKWNDAAQAKIADWASAKDLAGGLDSIRNNIEKWKLGTVPDFERFVRNYWYASYGLGECSKSREGEVLADANKYSSNYGKKIRYICRDSAWVEASLIEMDTYKWVNGEDGEIKTGDVTQLKYVYDAKKSAWRETTMEEGMLGSCIENNEGKVALHKGVNRWYICKSRAWDYADTIDVDTQGWVSGKDGEIKKGDTTNAFYKYDEVLNKWMMASHNDSTLNLNGCTTKLEGEIKKSSTDNTYYVCKGLDWVIAQEIDHDTYGEECSRKDVGKFINGKKNETNRYYCTENGWIFVTIDWSWDVPKEARLNPDVSYGSVTDSRDGKIYKTVKIGTQVWMAENLNYADSIKSALLKGGNMACWQGKDENCEVTGRLYTWQAAVLRSYGGCTDTNLVCLQPLQGVCPKGWHLPDYGEWQTLLETVGGKTKAAKVLKSSTGWKQEGNGLDAVGFSAIPSGGVRYKLGYEPGKVALFWSAVDGNSSTAFRLYLSYDSDAASLNNEDKSNKFSVRCIQN